MDERHVKAMAGAVRSVSSHRRYQVVVDVPDFPLAAGQRSR